MRTGNEGKMMMYCSNDVGGFYALTRAMKWYPKDRNLVALLDRVTPCVAEFAAALETEERVKDKEAALMGELTALYGQKKGKEKMANTNADAPNMPIITKQVK